MTTSADAPRDAYAAAAMLGCGVDEIGRCATCHGYTRRYGRGSTGPLCAECLRALEKRRAAPQP